MYTIVALTPDEQFLQFLDVDLCDVKETLETNGLRTIELEYKFQKYEEDKQLFQQGNKIWIQNDENLTDCLYVINTKVKEDIYKENSFNVECEEVLVELTNASFVSHLDLTKYSSVFKTRTTNGALEVKVDWNSLNFWFGNFFNLGVVQDCLNSNVQWIPFFGTYNRMSLLRYIEEQTGNVFITRYEKDAITNTIHRYLDFLNPINVNKNWEMHLEYDFLQEMKATYYDDDDNETTDNKPWEVTRFTNSHIDEESMDEIVSPYNPETDEALTQYDVEDTSYVWNAEDENEIDETTIKHYPTLGNITPANTQFQIVTPDGRILNADGTIYQTGDDNPLLWTAADLGLTTSNTNALITLSMTNNTIGLVVNDRSFAVITNPGELSPTYVSYTNTISEDTTTGNKRTNTVIPDDCYFEIYDNVNKLVLFRTQVNRSIGTVHSDILDFAFNMDNVQFDIDESDTYTSVSPVLQFNENNSTGNELTRANFTDLLTRYQGLSISKGEKIPMIMQKITVQAVSLEAAKVSLGSYTALSGDNESSSKANYWIRPYKPQDNIDSSTPANSTFEFWRATAYWNAPFNKLTGELNVSLDDVQAINYDKIYGRNDTRDDKGTYVFAKNGTTESSDEDIYSIYNQCALYLKDHSTPSVEIDVDVAHLNNKGQYNDYQIWDKVYIKVPGTSELITARVIETSKEANNISANTVKLSNYTTQTYKTVTNRTVINASNTNFNYPKSKELTVSLENVDYDSEDQYSIQYPGNKLISFTLYAVKDGQKTFKKVYTKKTDAYGQCSINMKYDPGSYEFEISFNGDEEYNECSTTVKVNVGGTKEVKTSNKSSTSSKTTKKTTQKVTKTTYYDKYGRSPDKKKILAIGKPSASGDQGAYDFYGMEFKNKCPHCGKQSLVWGIFWAGEHTNYGYFPGTKANEGGSIEGHIFCTHCDADYSCQGREHVSGGKKLTATKNRFKSSKSDAYKLRNGKYIYNKKVSTKTVTTNKTITRKIIGKPSKKVKNTALAIVDNKTGYKALRAICDWMDKNIHYGPGEQGYSGFQRSPDTVLKTKLGNCCDQTRLLFHLLDAAGICEYYDLYYVNLSCPRYGHVYGRIRSKKTKKWTNVDPASDTYGCYGYVCDSCDRSSPVDSKYPHLPF